MADISSLVTPERMSQKINEVISSDRLIELAQAEVIPHYVIDGKILFGLTETKNWLNQNFLKHKPGRNICDGFVSVINVISTKVQPDEIPVELRAMGSILIPIKFGSNESANVSGVYFLCYENKVVYVGQSCNVISRVGDHFGDKSFDSVYFIPIPTTELSAVEQKLIKVLRPKYNFGKKSKRLEMPSDRRTRVERSEYGLSVEKLIENIQLC